MFIGHFGAVIWRRFTIICGVPPKISVTHENWTDRIGQPRQPFEWSFPLINFNAFKKNSYFTDPLYLDILKSVLVDSVKKFGLLARLIRINSIINTIKTMIRNINLIYVTSGYYTTVPKLLILLPKVLILTPSNICGFI